ncbi:MAG: hypothetical protein P8X81_05050 [Woeseiaceae bacterium]
MSSVLPAGPARTDAGAERAVSGDFVDHNGERYYRIRNVDEMRPFFISVISSDDHWLFVSSTGGLTAGRVSPETALFPYVPVDRIHESLPHTGPRTIVRVHHADTVSCWEPFNREHRGVYATSRNLYKSALGDKLCFEETNHDLGLVFSYTWSTSAEHGFVRDCELQNISTADVAVDVVDGLQNILPAGTPRYTQSNSSNLVDAYKWTELDEQSGLAMFTLYSGITDRPEPCESLKATSAYCLGLDNPTYLLSILQLDAFRDGQEVTQERHIRGMRGAFLVVHSDKLARGRASTWRIVLDGQQDQGDVVKLRQTLTSDHALDQRISQSIAAGSVELANIMASADAFQATAEENVAVHHYANVLFNVLRGGIVADQYNVSASDFRRTIRGFNKPVYDRNLELLRSLPDTMRSDELVQAARDSGDEQLWRLALEYLPITFGRRHGDPSRPWNEFAIKIKDEHGKPLLSYQGNWRDIFQNWEALAFSYPDFAENMIAKFVNASTVDGYNPYRITKEGIDWEIEEADNPWSHIGYWGDHQIIYLLKLLELSRRFHPQKLHELLHDRVFCYANVPYRIKPLDKLFDDPKDTVVFDEKAAQLVDERVATLGADGKLVQDAAGKVYQVNLLEKLFVPLLAKLGNLVVDGGIWLNTQRPEWNDANNALVGQGLSMVTLYYMRRYVRFLADLLEHEAGAFALTEEVDAWFGDTATALAGLRAELEGASQPDALRFRSLWALGTAAADFRKRVYSQTSLSGTCEREIDSARNLLADAQAIIDHSIAANRRDDGLYHAYNVASFEDEGVSVGNLYPMLEGQVAALSAGTIAPDEAANVVDALFASSIYRADQNSFMLYPDRDLPGFLERNQLPEDPVRAIPLLDDMLQRGDERIIVRDVEGCLRFNSDFRNARDVVEALNRLGGDVTADRDAILDLYEATFHHSQFTGRSGTMFGFEGLGSIYWHMVSKLLLALAENFYDALDSGISKDQVRRLGDLYYRVRAGIGFNKNPAEYGAFPCDPYSHTPKHAGARQPGMTGQVKEEVLTRFAELGIRVHDGCVSFTPALLRAQEFRADSTPFCYLDVDGNWQDLVLPEASLAFTWCQVPIVYRLGDAQTAGLDIELGDGSQIQQPDLTLPAELSSDLFARNRRIRRITATVDAAMLFGGRQ